MRKFAPYHGEWWQNVEWLRVFVPYPHLRWALIGHRSARLTTNKLGQAVMGRKFSHRPRSNITAMSSPTTGDILARQPLRPSAAE